MSLCWAMADYPTAAHILEKARQRKGLKLLVSNTVANWCKLYKLQYDDFQQTGDKCIIKIK